MTTKPVIPYPWFQMPQMLPPKPPVDPSDPLTWPLVDSSETANELVRRKGDWKYGYCDGCSKELTPVLDGDGAKFCRDCEKELPF